MKAFGCCSVCKYPGKLRDSNVYNKTQQMHPMDVYGDTRLCLHVFMIPGSMAFQMAGADICTFQNNCYIQGRCACLLRSGQIQQATVWGWSSMRGGGAAQAQLKAGTEPKLRAAVPALTDAQVAAMRRCPMRSFDPAITQEPHIYRLTEARPTTATMLRRQLQ